MFNIVESFSGIGSQKKALDNLNVPVNVQNIIEWDINAIVAYDLIHHGKQDENAYQDLSKVELIEILSQYTLSSNGKEAVTPRGLTRFKESFLRRLLYAIKRTNNLVSITDVKAKDLDDDIDLFTYSFPCQDLSISGFWHGNAGGIDRDANNRSSMLWQVERILLEFEEINKPLPKFLLMENVPSIRSKRHIDNFNEWQEILKGLHYHNVVYDLQAEDFGIPQSRKRTFMLSIYIGENQTLEDEVIEYLKENNLEEVVNKKKNGDNCSGKKKLKDMLKLDYSNPVYRREALSTIPNYTGSRKSIEKQNPIIVEKDGSIGRCRVRTITTKQDRHPNSGIVYHGLKLEPNGELERAPFRYLTPRECFILMGFDESDYEVLINNNYPINTKQNIFTVEKLTKMAGNSIVVNILQAVFEQMMVINDILAKYE